MWRCSDKNSLEIALLLFMMRSYGYGQPAFWEDLLPHLPLRVQGREVVVSLIQLLLLKRSWTALQHRHSQGCRQL